MFLCLGHWGLVQVSFPIPGPEGGFGWVTLGRPCARRVSSTPSHGPGRSCTIPNLDAHRAPASALNHPRDKRQQQGFRRMTVAPKSASHAPAGPAPRLCHCRGIQWMQVPIRNGRFPSSRCQEAFGGRQRPCPAQEDRPPAKKHRGKKGKRESKGQMSSSGFYQQPAGDEKKAVAPQRSHAAGSTRAPLSSIPGVSRALIILRALSWNVCCLHLRVRSRR